MQKPKFSKYILSLSFGNFLKGDGGTDKVISEHEKIYFAKGYSYIQIAPVGSNADTMKIRIYSVVIDDHFYRLMEESELFEYLRMLDESGYRIKSVFIHHFKKFTLNFIETLLSYTVAQIVVYIHDYYTICKQYNLLKNNVEYCGEETPSQTKCYGCLFFDKERVHIKSFEMFFNKFAARITVVAPSESALNIWRGTYSELSSKSKVILHQKLNDSYTVYNKSTDRIKVAYIGRMVSQKGEKLWNKFIDTATSQELPYEFYYFGISENKYQNVKKITVFVTPDNLDAMVEALRKEQIQIVFLWSIWPETYSYTYYEALASNCFIVTNYNSGNIASMTEKMGNGKLFKNDEGAVEYMIDINRVNRDLQEYWSNNNFGPNNLCPNTEILELLPKQEFRFKIKKQIPKITWLFARYMNFAYKKKHNMNKK